MFKLVFDDSDPLWKVKDAIGDAVPVGWMEEDKKPTELTWYKKIKLHSFHFRRKTHDWIGTPWTRVLPGRPGLAFSQHSDQNRSLAPGLCPGRCGSGDHGCSGSALCNWKAEEDPRNDRQASAEKYLKLISPEPCFNCVYTPVGIALFTSVLVCHRLPDLSGPGVAQYKEWRQAAAARYLGRWSSQQDYIVWMYENNCLKWD